MIEKINVVNRDRAKDMDYNGKWLLRIIDKLNEVIDKLNELSEDGL